MSPASHFFFVRKRKNSADKKYPFANVVKNQCIRFVPPLFAMSPHHMSHSSTAATMADVVDGRCRRRRRPQRWPTSRWPRQWPTSTLGDVNNGDGHDNGRSRRTPSISIARPTTPPPLLLLPLPPRQQTCRDDGRAGIYRRCRSGDDVAPLLRQSSPRHLRIRLLLHLRRNTGAPTPPAGAAPGARRGCSHPTAFASPPNGTASPSTACGSSWRASSSCPRTTLSHAILHLSHATHATNAILHLSQACWPTCFFTTFANGFFFLTVFPFCTKKK